MKIVVSPAKSLNLDAKLPTDRNTQPQFLETTLQLNRELVKMSGKKIGELMNISDKLADLNYTRFQEFSKEHSNKNSRPAVYTFDGDVYTGLDVYTLPTEKLDQLQNSLRILSGMYGILRPLDLIQPYRLEMGTKLAIKKSKNLYEVWKTQVTDFLNNELKEDELFINLASNEYFKAVDTKKLKVPVITPVFKDWKNDQLKIISFYAKKARGLMLRYIMDTNSTTIEDLKGFNYEGYGFSEQYTEKENELVFVR
ncbi:peroxide stress protein YaaA [Aquimarina sp. ERC-38]|uniref:peroxide stress protein YaaA n=1 Tax=Aquimarina sp. ERC-38 TaxID=2949996 RepID=UPI0022461309|nr:peroxide stress protein YaaA [Aquimarina sp. ERC-38]UZO80538.1 peroxide stress protein YaaA [Aquimarina sp. ERC-38]